MNSSSQKIRSLQASLLKKTTSIEIDPCAQKRKNGTIGSIPFDRTNRFFQNPSIMNKCDFQRNETTNATERDFRKNEAKRSDEKRCIKNQRRIEFVRSFCASYAFHPIDQALLIDSKKFDFIHSLDRSNSPDRFFRHELHEILSITSAPYRCHRNTN